MSPIENSERKMFKVILASFLFIGMVLAQCDEGQTPCGDACCPKGYVGGIFNFLILNNEKKYFHIFLY